MSCDTVRPPHLANKIFPMATSEIGHHVESCQNQCYISTGHWLCLIIMKLAIYDLQTKLNKCAKNLFLIQNRLAVTANQTWRQSRQTGSKPVLTNSLTFHSQTQSSWNLPYMIFRPSWTDLLNSFFLFKTVWPWQPFKLDGKAVKQEVSLFSAYLLNIS
jgi:hypothetical protein